MTEITNTALTEATDSSKNKLVESSIASQISTIGELKPTSYDKVIEVRVYRKWISVSYPKKDASGFSGKKTETAFCCILIDKEV